MGVSDESEWGGEGEKVIYYYIYSLYISVTYIYFCLLQGLEKV